MDEEVTSVRIQNDETKVCGVIKKFQLTCLPLGEALDLANDVFGICTILELGMLRELTSTIHLVYHIFCGLRIV